MNPHRNEHVDSQHFAGHTNRPPRGFTLLEVLIVVTLMTILAAIMIPRFEPSIHDELTSVAQIVAADIDYARHLAVTNNSTYRLTFNVAQDSYVLSHSGTNTLLDVLPRSPFGQSSDTPDQQTTDLDDLPHIGPTVQLSAVHKMDAAATPVTNVEFGPLGETTRQEQTNVWLACGQGAERRFICVCIDPVTGLASIGDFQATAPPGGS